MTKKYMKVKLHFETLDEPNSKAIDVVHRGVPKFVYVEKLKACRVCKEKLAHKDKCTNKRFNIVV